MEYDLDDAQINQINHERALIQSVYSTKDGEELLALWKTQFVDPPCPLGNSEQTHYALALKEFVHEIILQKSLNLIDKTNAGDLINE